MYTTLFLQVLKGIFNRDITKEDAAWIEIEVITCAILTCGGEKRKRAVQALGDKKGIGSTFTSQKSHRR